MRSGWGFRVLGFGCGEPNLRVSGSISGFRVPGFGCPQNPEPPTPGSHPQPRDLRVGVGGLGVFFFVGLVFLRGGCPFCGEFFFFVGLVFFVGGYLACGVCGEMPRLEERPPHPKTQPPQPTNAEWEVQFTNSHPIWYTPARVSDPSSTHPPGLVNRFGVGVRGLPRRWCLW